MIDDTKLIVGRDIEHSTYKLDKSTGKEVQLKPNINQITDLNAEVKNEMPNTISVFESIPTTTEEMAQKSIPYLNTNSKDALFFQGYSSYICNHDNENINKRNISTSSLKR